MMSVVFFLLLAGIAAAFLMGSRRQKARELEERAEELERVKKTVEEDVVAFGEEVADLDLITVDRITPARSTSTTARRTCWIASPNRSRSLT
jgi:hypothetical protein